MPSHLSLELVRHEHDLAPTLAAEHRELEREVSEVPGHSEAPLITVFEAGIINLVVWMR